MLLENKCIADSQIEESFHSLDQVALIDIAEVKQQLVEVDKVQRVKQFDSLSSPSKILKIEHLEVLIVFFGRFLEGLKGSCEQIGHEVRLEAWNVLHERQHALELTLDLLQGLCVTIELFNVGSHHEFIVDQATQFGERRFHTDELLGGLIKALFSV